MLLDSQTGCALVCVILRKVSAAGKEGELVTGQSHHGRLVKTTLGDQVTRAIVEHIQENDLKPGDMLPAELTLARQLGVSRPLIREAIRSLNTLGVLVTANGKGTTICPVGSYGLTTLLEWAVTVQGVSMLGVLQLREGLEVEAASRAAENRTDMEAAELVRLVGEMREALHDAERHAELDLQLHLTIARSAHNALLSAFTDALRQVAIQTMTAGAKIATRSEWAQIQRHHEDLVAAIQARDVDGSRSAMLEHFRSALQRFGRAEP
jgi:GntR family transcriptional regulator, transcriptional repressor for pyruvate dehydrogenase complex